MEKKNLPPPKKSLNPGNKFFGLFLLFFNTFYKNLSPRNCLRKISEVKKKEVQISPKNPPKTDFEKIMFFVFFQLFSKRF